MNKYVGKVKLSELETAEYQRGIESRVKKIIENFDIIQVRPLHISLRDGKKYIVDGNHTSTVLKAIYGEDYMADAFIYEGLTYKEEAELFIKLNTNSKKTSYNDNLKAKIEAGFQDAIAYKEMLDLSGIKYSFTNGNSGKNFVAHKTSFECFKKYGTEACVNAFKVIDNVDDADFYNGRVFNGLAIVFFKNPNIDKVSIKKAITKNGYDKLYALASVYGRNSSSGFGGSNWAKAIAEFYNKGRRSGKIEI